MEETKEKSKKIEKQEPLISKIKNVIAKLKKHKKRVMFGAVMVFLGAIVLSVVFSKAGSVTTVVESSLKDVVETSELSTVEYIYNSTVAVCDEKQNPKYYIAYEGTVKAGFDFNEITVEKDKDNKKIVIVIPEIKINSVNINDKTLDYIFVNDKYDTETTFQEAYKKSYEDLERKAESNESVKKMARDNAIDSMKAIILPLESKLPEGYTYDFR